MRPFNHNIICKDESSNTQESNSGFVTRKEERFKTLEVLTSAEIDVATGDLVRVRINAGDADGDNIIINRGDIIYIL
jgi:hypothetical protein